MFIFDDTIAAISTPPGDGGIGIIRLSGPQSISIVSNIFSLKNSSIDLNSLLSHKLNYGYIIDPDRGSHIDEVLLSVMKRPGSYTREDVVEINSHSGIVILRKILDLVLKYGARLAEPGEFTKRAFLNGRIDLTQAEAVMDVIRAKTDSSLAIANNQLEGKLSCKIKILYDKILDVLANIEADIDYPEDDISPVDFKYIKNIVSEVIKEIENLLSTSEYGKIFREGIKVAITGRTNVGKSSLLNALLRENRAIVTEIPGTTRDTIEEYLNIKDIPVQIIDTAGIRHTIDPVEKIGVQRTYDVISRADMVLYLMDISEDFSPFDLEIINNIMNKKLILVLNKTDLPQKLLLPDELFSKKIVKTSLLTPDGVEKVEEAIIDSIYSGLVTSGDGIVVSNIRHKKALNDTFFSLEEVQHALKAGFSSDIIALELRNSINYLGDILGYTVTEDVLNRIFENFCVGK